MGTDLSKENLKYCEETIALKKTIEQSFLSLGERLARIRENEMFRPSYESFPEFLEEIQMSPGTASKLINIYIRFVVDMKLPKEKLMALNGWADLSDILPIAKTKAEAIALIDKLAPMRREDRRAYLTSQKTGIPFLECKHPECYEIKICKLCKQKV